MKIKINYIIIPIITILVSLLGGFFTSQGISSGWYDSLNRPEFTPPGSLIGMVWTFIYILATISALIIWNGKRNKYFLLIIFLFILNALLNAFWSFFFFFLGMIGFSILESLFLLLSIFFLIILIWPLSKIASILLMPYAAWVSFATYLMYVIWLLNT